MNISNIAKQYRTNQNITYSCQYHVVFTTKYKRRLLIGDVEARAVGIFYDVAKEYDFEIIEIEVMPEYVHMIIDCNPRFGVVECITKLKGYSHRMLREEFTSLRTRVPTLWTRNAFVSSIGEVSLINVRQFIEEQKRDQRR